MKGKTKEYARQTFESWNKGKVLVHDEYNVYDCPHVGKFIRKKIEVYTNDEIAQWLKKSMKFILEYERNINTQATIGELTT
jgi:chromosome condensin MukBEF complex kleisin-like MukF subunit